MTEYETISYDVLIIGAGGAVIEGVGGSVMGLSDTRDLIEALGVTAREVLHMARSSGKTSSEVAEARARHRIEQRRTG